ncbi:hypothetical protein [Dyella acidisoli]|uniref:DUF3077 domain-containing protein n=1 Tax=Dyella acidisoli TaxID=1867834 RepID=A0ABQ5XUG5_9GAMM|nr:hypothetical protein [Dyella acidisoli]GLQ95253.1 hypothetical protein GCM10007901_42080 [Dyella acidisoli]
MTIIQTTDLDPILLEMPATKPTPLFVINAAATTTAANDFTLTALAAIDELLCEGEEHGLSPGKSWLVRHLMHAREATLNYAVTSE